MVRPPWELTREMFLSEVEVDMLLRCLRQQAHAASVDKHGPVATDLLIIACLVFSGLRNSEFCRLRIADTIVGAGESVFKVCGTPRQDRTVHVPRFVSSLVVEYVERIRPGMLPETIKPADQAQPLLFNERRRPYERTGLYRRVVKILNAAGLGERASVQLLRHTYGYLGYKRSGGNLLFLQRQLGHAHPMVTKVYAEFVHEDYAQIADLVGGQPLPT